MQGFHLEDISIQTSTFSDLLAPPTYPSGERIYRPLPSRREVLLGHGPSHRGREEVGGGDEKERWGQKVRPGRWRQTMEGLLCHPPESNPYVLWTAGSQGGVMKCFHSGGWLPGEQGVNKKEEKLAMEKTGCIENHSEVKNQWYSAV